MERARMLAYLELDNRHTLDSSFFISDREFHVALGKLHSTYDMNTDSLEEFHIKNRINFLNLGYGDCHSFVFDKHEYFSFVCMKSVGWLGDKDIDSQCYVKVPYKTTEEIMEEFSFLFKENSIPRLPDDDIFGVNPDTKDTLPQDLRDPEWYEFD
jgi:hypothetical protein